MSRRTKPAKDEFDAAAEAAATDGEPEEDFEVNEPEMQTFVLLQGQHRELDTASKRKRPRMIVYKAGTNQDGDYTEVRSLRPLDMIFPNKFKLLDEVQREQISTTRRKSNRQYTKKG